ncbi:MAG TPA: DinB family protein [Thermoanaerobaculia bacterium]|jgi:uncharacterized damage-inducible protein DinB|nr:DinB family protein [Thermoanaerobaculia bacterium]
MSGITQPYISELEQEAKSTRKVLERVPADKLDWQPHPKSMKLGQLALHVANLPGAFARMGRLDSFDASQTRFNPPMPQGVDELLPTLEAGVADARTFLGELDDEAAMAPWRFTHGERELFTVPRLGLVRSLMFNHMYHHRGQLVVYLRLLDIPVPSVYGPSADENPFAAAVKV